MDGLLQFQADQLGVVVHRPTDQETTALGAAYLAGLAEGVWPDTAAVGAHWRLDASFEPAGDQAVVDAGYAAWLRAVERSRSWVAASADERVGDGGEQRDA
jgi:glycerol kinase